MKAKIADVTGCLGCMAWAWADCEDLPPRLRDLSERWGIRWFWVTKWLQGEAQQLWREMKEEEKTGRGAGAQLGVRVENTEIERPLALA